MPRKIFDDPKDSAVFSAEVFHSELNKAFQRRENNRRQKEYKKKKLLDRNHTLLARHVQKQTSLAGEARRKGRAGSGMYMGTRQITLLIGARLYTLSIYRRRPS